MELLEDKSTCRKLTISPRNRGEEKRKQLCDITYAELFIMAANILTLSMLSLKMLPHIIAKLLKRKISNITQLYTDRRADGLNFYNPLLSYKKDGASPSTFIR
jgi:hypothetical protein